MTKMTIRQSLRIGLLLITGAGLGAIQLDAQARLRSAAIGPSGGYFPLAAGNSWTYAITGFAGQGSHTISVSGVEEIGGNLYYRLDGYADTPALVRALPDGTVVEYDRETRGERLWYDFRAAEGASWPAIVNTNCPATGVVRSRSGSVKVPAGEFARAFVVQYMGSNCADAGFEEEVFAAGVGLVRRTSQTIGGPRHFELISAQVGSSTIAPEGLSFSLSIDKPVYVADRMPPVDPNRLVPVMRANMKIRNTSDVPVVLQFNSGQKFDLVVRGESGAEVLRWSAGKVFTLAVESFRLAPGEQGFTAELPLAVSEGVPLDPGAYTVEAWLTTTEGKLFSATVAFQMSAAF
jgi:hypothetical protein